MNNMNLKKFRTSKGLTLKKLSELSGVPQRTIEDIEAKDDCRVSTAKKLAKALEVTLDELC